MSFTELLYYAAVIIFTGNMFWGLIRKINADRTNDPSVMHLTLKSIVKNDVSITIPSLLIVLLFNYDVNMGKLLLGSSIGLSYAIWWVSAYSILTFILIIHPLRSALIRLTADPDNFSVKKYRSLSGIWVMFGIMELGPLILALLLSLPAIGQ
jgi:hypothetical protein